MPKQERVKTKYPGIYNEAKHNLRTYNFVGISGICPTWQLRFIEDFTASRRDLKVGFIEGF